ncbi:MAG: carbohydrate kinase family protein, partial [Geminicoccaceae bacterium]
MERLRVAAARTTVAAIGAVNYDEIFMLTGGLRDDGIAHVSVKRVLAGGHAANCASALAQLEFSTAVIGSVGKDGMGRWLIRDLKKRGIDVSGVLAVDAPTGRAIIPVFESGHFMIIERGANDALVDLPANLLTRYSMIALFDPALPALEHLAHLLSVSDRPPDVYWTPGGHYVSHPIVRRILPHLRAIF